MTQDKVMDMSITVFEKLDETVEKYNIPREAIDDFNAIYMDIVADLVIHFCAAAETNKEGFEMWKRNMGLKLYCGWALDEIEHGECWDVNWFKARFGTDISEPYAELYNSFINLC